MPSAESSLRSGPQPFYPPDPAAVTMTHGLLVRRQEQRGDLQRVQGPALSQDKATWSDAECPSRTDPVGAGPPDRRNQPHARVATRPLERVLPYLLVAPVLLYIFVVLILPILIEVYYSFLTREQGTFTFRIVHQVHAGQLRPGIHPAVHRRESAFTMGISFVIAVGTVVLGMPVAQFLARGTGRGKILIEMCLLLPLFGDIFTALRVALRVRAAGHRELVPDGDRADPGAAPPR